MPTDVTAEIHGYSRPDATPTPWEVGREQIVAAETFCLSTVRPDGRPHVTPLIGNNASCILTTGRSELVEGGLDVVLEGAAEQVTDGAQLQPIAEAFAAKYGTETWDFVVHDGAFSHRDAGGRALVFRVRPARGLGFRKGRISSQTTWRFPA